jgi:hypothetical protein
MRFFLLPSLGLALLAWGAWASWRDRHPGPFHPPLEWRVAAGLLGALGGWVLANLAYAPDAAHRVVGLPLPVCTLVRDAGTWTDQTSPLFVPCLLLDILLCVLLAGRALRAVWPRLQPARARRRNLR